MSDGSVRDDITESSYAFLMADIHVVNGKEDDGKNPTEVREY